MPSPTPIRPNYAPRILAQHGHGRIQLDPSILSAAGGALSALRKTMTRTCQAPNCGREFTGGVRAKFCCTRCRKRWHRHAKPAAVRPPMFATVPGPDGRPMIPLPPLPS